MIDHDLLELLSLAIPEQQKREPTFLDITGQTYKENIISRVYAYFLNSENNREIAALFLNALTELIKENKKIQFEDFVCKTEQTTKDGKRIDLIIDSPVDKKCIIIENKIFHWLHNDLDKYWEINNYEDHNKAGVLLTLKPQTIEINLKARFVNITHKQWIERIKSKGLPVGISAKEFIYLNDFITHIENITENMEMNEQAKFFFNYPDKVLKAMNTHTQAYNYIISQLKIATEKMNCELYGNSGHWRHIRDKKYNEQIYYAVEFGEIMSKEPKINIIIQLDKDAISKNDLFREKLIDNTYYLNLSNENRHGNGWLHFANKWYNLNVSDIENLSDFILDKIEENFSPIMNVLLKEEKSTQIEI